MFQIYMFFKKIKLIKMIFKVVTYLTFLSRDFNQVNN